MGKNKRHNKQQPHKNAHQTSTAAASTATNKNKIETTAGSSGGSQTSNNKNNKSPGVVRVPIIHYKERLVLNQLIQSILHLVELQPTNANEEWKQFVELQQLLDRIIKLEQPLARAVCPADESRDSEQARLAKVVAFNEWARAGGVQSDSVEIAIFPGYQLGLRATRDLTVGDQVLSVPRKLIFSEEQLPDVERKVFSSFPLLTNLSLTYALVIEKVRGDASEWQPYIDTLPASYNTVLYFSVEQMQRLRGTSACSAALRQCRVIARQYASMYKCAYIQTDKSVMAAMAVLFTQHGLCYELYRWAVSTVMTRQNLVPSELLPVNDSAATELRNVPISALIPYWDMANHRSGKITSYYDSAARQMDCTAQEPCKAGEQFFIYYGDRSNADLLVHNGFLDTLNNKDYVQIRLGLSPTDALAEQRALLLTKLNIERKAELRVLPAPEHISGELLAFVRVFNMSQGQLEHWCSDWERAVDLLHIDCALETDLETRTWQYLYQRLKLLLGVIELTLHESDEVQQLAQLQLHCTAEKEPNVQNQEIDIMVLQYRQLERRILTDALQYAQERLKV